MPELQIGEEAEQQEIVRFLSSFAPRADVIETHAARVVLAGDMAFKIKKRVKLPFLDFTSLEARKAALSREQELNAPHAPEIYRGVRAITRGHSGAFALEGDGPIIDWVLEMRRFDGVGLLLEIARQGPLKRALAEKLADMAAAYHLTAPIRYRNDGTTAVSQILDGLLTGFRAACRPMPDARIQAFENKARNAIRHLSPLLDHRAIGGAVRRCHGDLHLGNIVLIDGRTLPFDALEFDEALAEIDVLYDLAFLLMDLLRLGDRAAANTVLNAYVSRAPLGTEIDGLATLPLFIALRAAVRSLVALMRDQQVTTPTEQAEAHAFLALAMAKLQPDPPVLIAVGGFSGSGKTTMARGLAPLMPSAAGALHLRSDVIRKRLFDVPETERLSPRLYTQAVSDQVYAITFRAAGRALDQGHSVIVDAVFSKREERDAIAEVAAAHGCRFLGLWLEAPAEELIHRVETRRGDASDATAEVVSRQLAQPIGRVTWTRVQTKGSESESLALVSKAAADAGVLAKPRTEEEGKTS